MGLLERRPERWRRRFRHCTLTVTAAVVILAGAVAGSGVAHASAAYLDVDITSQVLSEIIDGQVVYATHISTGSGDQFWNGNDWEWAETPRGWFEVYYKDPGWVEAPLGWLYDAMYFYGGYAIHGSGSVPDYPASHGCVRVSMDDADGLFAAIGIGTPVFVHD